MVLILKKGASKAEVADLNKKLYQQKSKSGFNAKKYNGLLKIKGDPLRIQNNLRDEWERDIS